jgi:hypothetical protein
MDQRLLYKGLKKSWWEEKGNQPKQQTEAFLFGEEKTTYAEESGGGR